MKTKEIKRDPKVKLYKNPSNGCARFHLSVPALELLVQNGERYVAIVPEENGSVSLMPLDLPKNTASVVQIHDLRGTGYGCNRIVLPKSVLNTHRAGGTFKCVWNDIRQCLEVLTEETEPSRHGRRPKV